jgi:hypothetical protein
VTHGILADEARSIIDDFIRALRARPKPTE